MKQTSSFNPGDHRTGRVPAVLVLTFAAVLSHQLASAAIVELGTASSFGVLAGAGITNTGPTTISGDAGSFETLSMTGFDTVVLLGTNHAGDAVTQTAKTDLTTAYNDAAGRSFFMSFAGGFDLVGQTLIPGVYHGDTSLFLSGTVMFDAQGDPDAVWIVQAGSTLITAPGSRVALINGAQACNVFWQVGSSATLDTDTDFAGNILALTSITLNSGTTVDGRVLARNGAVTLSSNIVTVPACITVPEPGSALLFTFGMVTLLASRRRHG